MYVVLVNIHCVQKHTLIKAHKLYILLNSKEHVRNNQFISTIVKQGERRLIEIPTKQKEKFEKFVGKDLKISIEEL